MTATAGEVAAAHQHRARGPDFVQSLERGLAVLRAFDGRAPQLTLSEVARACDLNRASTRRFLHTFVELGYVATDGHRFSLRPRLLELGYAYLSTLALPQLALPHLQRLSEQVRESTSVSVLDGDDITYVERVHARRIMRADISVGTRLPAYATSMGRVLLAAQAPRWLEDYLARVHLAPLTARTITDVRRLEAELALVRPRGWCLVEGELEDGLCSLALPLRDAAGAVTAAVNISFSSNRGPVGEVAASLLVPARVTAAAIEADLHWAGSGPARLPVGAAPAVASAAPRSGGA